MPNYHYVLWAQVAGWHFMRLNDCDFKLRTYSLKNQEELCQLKILTCKMDTLHPTHNFCKELMVVLVIYKMEIAGSAAFRSLTKALQSADQQTSIFIYDNSPNTQTPSPSDNWVIEYRNDPGNPGVSKAYNEGYKYAKAQGKKWMLLVDQDTVFEVDYFIKCVRALEEHANEMLFVPTLCDPKGIVSPFYFYFGRGHRLKKITQGQCQLAKKKFINSGMLIACDLFEKAGGFDEKFELDFSDLVFLERLKSKIRTFYVIDSIGGHSLFSSSPNSVLENLQRFKRYCYAADLFARQTGNFWVLIGKYFRSVVFFFRYFDWRFISLLVQNDKQIQ